MIIEQILASKIKDTVTRLYPDFTAWDKLFVQPATNESFGDYQTNFAMTAAKELRQPPRVIAQAIADHMPDDRIIEKTEVAGPGFLNIYLAKSFIADQCKNALTGEYDFSFLDTTGEIIIDYSSPNIAKPMHIGHLRSTVLGDSLKRIYTFLGYTTVGDNHLGDWGTQFGKLIVAYRKWLDPAAYAENPVAELERIYVLFDKHTQDNPELEEEARLQLRKLQDGDPANTGLWNEFISVSIKEYAKIYARLGITFDSAHGESFYHAMMPEVITLLKNAGLAEESEGATVVFFDEKEGLHPCIVQKKDGAFLYATSDLACIKYRREHYPVNKIIYVTDERQQAHFKQLFAIARMLGWKENLEHIWFGLMRFADGIFSSRKGNVIKLEDLLDEAVTRARAIIEEKNPGLPEHEKIEIAEKIGVGAVKYADLGQNRTSTVVFEWDKALSFEGNTAPYLQYTYARIQSIKRNAETKGHLPDPSAPLFLDSAAERSLASAISSFPSAVLKAAEHSRPNIIADYLFELAQKFNTFYNAMPILKEVPPLLSSRLLLAHITGLVIKKSLLLLGIDTVERMQPAP